MHGIAIKRQGDGALAAAAQAITEAGGERKALDGREVGIDGAVHIEAAVARKAIVAHDHRVRLLAGIELGNAIVATFGVGHELLSLCQSVAHVVRQGVGGIGVRRQRVEHHDRSEQRTILVVARNGAHIVLLYLVGGAHGQPFLHLVFRVDGGCQAAIDVGIALHNAIIIKIGEAQIVVAALASALERDVVLHHLAAPEGAVYPVGVGLAVPVLQQVVLRECLSFAHILDVFLGIQHLRRACDGLSGKLEVVTDAAFAHLSLLRRYQNDAVSGLCAIDGGTRRVLQNLH